jgi:hypothetical protein
MKMNLLFEVIGEVAAEIIELIFKKLKRKK